MFATYATAALGWVKKNWKIIAIVVALLYFSGIFRNIINRIKINSWVREYQADPVTVDYRLIAMQVHDAFDKALWFKDRDAITALVNSLGSQAEFLTLVRVYALEYNKDLRAELRDHFSDKKYAELRWK